MVTQVKVRHPGSLVKEGYHLNEPTSERHAALLRADRIYGKAKVDQKLSALNRWNSHNPAKKRVVRSDLSWNEEQGGRGTPQEVNRMGKVWVEPYTRADGTRVKGHYATITARDRAVDRRNGRKARGSTWGKGRRK